MTVFHLNSVETAFVDLYVGMDLFCLVGISGKVGDSISATSDIWKVLKLMASLAATLLSSFNISFHTTRVFVRIYGNYCTSVCLLCLRGLSTRKVVSKFLRCGSKSHHYQLVNSTRNQRIQILYLLFCRARSKHASCLNKI